ncbi:MAG: class I SAM-dependent methyltransferase [Gammaproteobacteria bacterium]|nr:class I SAM-dependent methyltransferase [Gammaproteobacteria bacterium]
MLEIKEHEIRPRAIFDEYLRISKADIPKFFSNTDQFVKVSCPACGIPEQHAEFVKHGFRYVSCPGCDSLYVSPRPTAAMIDRFYRDSESSRYWAEVFFPSTAEARRTQIFEPRAQMISAIVERFEPPRPRVLADVGAGIGLFLEAAKSSGRFDEVIGIEPGRDLARVCRQRGHMVIEKPIEAVRADEVRASIVTSFEVFEHLYDPGAFVKSMANILAPNGILIFTTLSVTGFDLQILWDKSKSISPPHHINFVSVPGFAQLIDHCGLELLDVMTPGRLDADIVKNMAAEDDELELPRFVKTMLKLAQTERYRQLLPHFQKFLADSSLSSHVCVVARKV